MRKIFISLMAAVLVLGAGLSSLSFAQGMGDMMGEQPMMGSKPMMGKDMMKSAWIAKGDMKEKCPMHGMMMKGMMDKAMVATTDGGVIVLAGDKLIKYDSNLNVVKEVEIKMDMEAMQKKMTEMMKDCPMMKEGKMGAGMAEKLPVQIPPAATGTE